MAPSTADIAAARPAYQAELSRGPEQFLEPRLTHCPWCGSDRLAVRLRVRDWVQLKPGEFVLDRCRDCDHTFQNPRLNEAGLDFYYRDFYDGLGGEAMAELMSSGSRHSNFRGSVAAVSPHITPRTWLDVGTAHGHFPQFAAQILPDTEFHGLDMGEGVQLAAKAGRVSQAFRGLLTELADTELAAGYDVVSMFHYLEHTTDPRRELAAAHTALRPGGLLMIEVPNPQSPFGWLLGKYWVPWFQPQHLHLIPLANLREHLNRAGFTVVAAEYGTSHIPVDFIAANWFLINRILPREDQPWRTTQPGRLARWTRRLAILVALPLVLPARALDHLLAPLARRTSLSNAYRIVARRH